MYSSHSLRRGGATHAAEQGVSRRMIPAGPVAVRRRGSVHVLRRGGGYVGESPAAACALSGERPGSA
jgi:transposase InsO family protein